MEHGRRQRLVAILESQGDQLLTELLLALELAAYLMARVVAEIRQQQLYPPTLLLALLIAAIVPAFLAMPCACSLRVNG